MTDAEMPAMAKDREPLSALESVERFGWPSELLGLPRLGGSTCACVAARIGGGWRGWAEQREDVAAARAATQDHDTGDIATLKRILDHIDRQINDMEGYARLDRARAGVIEPSLLARIDALRARRQHIRMLVTTGFPPPPI